MGHLHENLTDLLAARGRHAELVGMKLELERGARASSRETANRARKLFTSASLAMLHRGDLITVQTLTQEIETASQMADKYAVLLCRDWLGVR